MSRLPVILTLTLSVIALFPGAFGSGLAPQGAVLNGDFELFDDPSYDAKCLVFGDGSINVFDPSSGLPWLVGVRPCDRDASFWSNSASTKFERVGADRAALVTPGVIDPDGAQDHNLWQTFGTPSNQGYTGDFEAFRFDVEAGTMPASAKIQISFSTTPLESQHPWVGIFIECSLDLASGHFTSTDGVTYTADPTSGNFFSRYVACDEAAAAWVGADADERRDILGRLRIVQVSFWHFNHGAASVVLDNVALDGVTTVAEEAARQGL